MTLPALLAGVDSPVSLHHVLKVVDILPHDGELIAGRRRFFRLDQHACALAEGAAQEGPLRRLKSPRARCCITVPCAV